MGDHLELDFTLLDFTGKKVSHATAKYFHMPIVQQLESQTPRSQDQNYVLAQFTYAIRAQLANYSKKCMKIVSSINLATHNHHDEDQGLRYVLSHNRPPAPNTLGRVSRPQGK